jgi:hypothetical protein
MAKTKNPLIELPAAPVVNNTVLDLNCCRVNIFYTHAMLVYTGIHK